MSTLTAPRIPEPRDRATSGSGAMLRANSDRYLGLSMVAWIQVGALATLMAVLFWPNLRRLILKTNPFTGEANWGHSIVIPVIGIYYLYVNRDELLAAKVTPILPDFRDRKQTLGGLALALFAGILFVLPNLIGLDAGPLSLGSYFHTAATFALLFALLVVLLNWGIGTLIFGVVVAGYGIWPGRNDTVWDYGMVVTLFGVVLLMCGWQVMKVAWFPIVFLFAAVPFPGLIYSLIASPLQRIAAEVAVFTLNVCHVSAEQSGTKINMGNALMGEPVRTLNVAEACAGLRSLMTFISVAAAMGFLSNRPLWQKIMITLSAIPIAIGCNVMRISGQGLLDHYWTQQISEGFAHQFVGLAMLVPAFFLILLFCWLLDQIFVEEVEAPKRAANGAAARAKVKRKPPGTLAKDGTSQNSSGQSNIAESR